MSEFLESVRASEDNKLAARLALEVKTLKAELAEARAAMLRQQGAHDVAVKRLTEERNAALAELHGLRQSMYDLNQSWLTENDLRRRAEESRVRAEEKLAVALGAAGGATRPSEETSHVYKHYGAEKHYR